MPMTFEVALAVMFGVEEAVLLQNLMFWVLKNKANGANFHDGRYWTYNTAAAFEKLFPFWSKPKIYRLLDSLEKQGAIFSGNYNKVVFDKTRWYAVADELLDGSWITTWKSQNQNIDVAEIEHRSNETATPIPDINTDVTTDIKPKCVYVQFEEFWALYPRKDKKVESRKAWEKLRVTLELYGKITRSLMRFRETDDWRKDGGKFVPMAVTWLNQRRWEDVTESAEPVRRVNMSTMPTMTR